MPGAGEAGAARLVRRADDEGAQQQRRYGRAATEGRGKGRTKEDLGRVPIDHRPGRWVRSALKSRHQRCQHYRPLKARS